MIFRTAPAVAAASTLLLTFAAGAQQPAVPPDEAAPEITVAGGITPLAGPDDFISPMGQPFRSDDKLSGAEHWFRQADADHDGRLTRAEFLADAARFFKIVDTDGNGTIEPPELEHYETDIAPEVTVASTYGDLSKMTTDSDGKLVEPPYPSRLGAGRFGYLAAPEPIASADANMDRGVTRLEFQQTAAARFKALDLNGDGAITRSELPKLGSPREVR